MPLPIWDNGETTTTVQQGVWRPQTFCELVAVATTMTLLLVSNQRTASQSRDDHLDRSDVHGGRTITCEGWAGGRQRGTALLDQWQIHKTVKVNDDETSFITRIS